MVFLHLGSQTRALRRETGVKCAHMRLKIAAIVLILCAASVALLYHLQLIGLYEMSSGFLPNGHINTIGMYVPHEKTVRTCGGFSFLIRDDRPVDGGAMFVCLGRIETQLKYLDWSGNVLWSSDPVLAPSNLR